MKLNLRKIQHLAVLSIKNGIKLYFDSHLLYKNKSYGTSLFVSVIAMEELGKGFAAGHFATTSIVNPRASIELEKEFLSKLFGDHKTKQLSFISQLWPHNNYMKHYWDVKERIVDKMKQDAIYVGLTIPAGNAARTKGKIINPLKTQKGKAKKQLRLLDEVLFDNAEGIKEERIQYDLKAMNNIFDETLLVKLKKLRKSLWNDN